MWIVQESALKRQQREEDVFTAHLAPPPLSGVFHSFVNGLRAP